MTASLSTAAECLLHQALIIVVAHLAIAAVWVGSMVYSLVVVQPRVERFFPDAEGREEFLLILANGNRWPVAALIAGLLGTGVALLALAPGGRLGYGVALVLYALAAALFARVSWRHWPARVFALPEELAGYQRRLRQMAWTMLALAGAGFLTALTVTSASGTR